MFIGISGARGACAAILILTALSWPFAAAAKNDDDTPTGGPKKSISVGTFESPEMMAGGATGEGLSAMLADALVKDGRFVVLERAAMPQVQAEQQLQGTTSETAAKTGNLLGSSALVLGTVTKFNPQAGGGTVNVGGFGGSSGNSWLGGVGNSVGATDVTAEVEINIRLIDTSTAQIIWSGAASGTASSRGVNATLYTKSGMQIGGQAFLSTPLGQAAQDAIHDAVKKIRIGMKRVPWSALVIEDDNGVVYIAAGANENIQSGMTLQVYRKSKDLVDPATGAVLDTLVDSVGTVQVQTVRDKTSQCTVTSGNAPARGDILKLQ